MKKLRDTLQQIDAFGKGVNFKVKGNNAFGTRFGAILTLLIYAVMLIYAQKRVQILIFRLDTSHQTSIDEYGLRQDEEFTLGELEANFMFMLFPNNFSKPHNLSLIKDYVNFEAVVLTRSYEDNKLLDKEEILQMLPCTETDRFF